MSTTTICCTADSEIPADGISVAAKQEFGTSRWQLSDQFNVRLCTILAKSANSTHFLSMLMIGFIIKERESILLCPDALRSFSGDEAVALGSQFDSYVLG